MTACPDDDLLGAYLQRVLDDAAVEDVAAHLDECPSCRAIVLAAIRGGVATPVPSERAMAETVVDARIAKRAPGTAAIGSTIGRYRVRALIGGGGMGHVYEAYDQELDRSLALKVLRPDLRGSAAVLAERLIRESRLMAKVVHPSVITVHDVGRDGDAVFIAMELIRGDTLGSYAAAKPWREIVELYERAGEGLAAAHRAGIVHRDFKPDNVLIELVGGRAGRVVVTDFGIAFVAIDDAPRSATVPSDIKLTTTGAAIGTPAYMAPEQLAGGIADVRSDVFAFTVSLWESLFGTRPFPGASVAEIQTALKSPPRADEARDVPAKVIRILEGGLAIDPAARPALADLIAELASTRRPSKALWIAAGLVAVAGGVTAIAMLGRSAPASDPCNAGLVTLAQGFDPIALHASLGGDLEVAARVMPKVNAIAAAWRDTHAVTCVSDRQPIQQPAITACLDARRLELGGFVDDLRADGPGMAVALVRTIGDPAACAKPAPSLTSSNVPDDPALRRRVTPIRYRMIEARVFGEKGELAKVDFVALANDAKVWPRVHAEALYLLGMAQAQGGDPKAATKTYREAAAVAQTAHHDLVAADCWIELTAIATFDDGDATRGLEYLTYAEAALERLGHPVELEAQLAYVKGTTLIEANRVAEAETSLRRAIELGTTAEPETLAQALQGLGYLHERQGRYADAVAAYRQAIDRLAAMGQAGSANDAIFRTRLALDLALLGNGDEAEREARRAVEVADRSFGPDSPDRASAHEALAHVLHSLGKDDDALAVARAVRAEIARSAGERSKHYADLLALEGEILDGVGRFADAVTAFERACDILAFETGADSVAVAQCRVSESHALAALGKRADALGIVDRAVPLLRTAYGVHPLVARALVTRGEIHGDLGHRSLAIEDLEAAIAILDKAAFDPGVLGSAQFALARQLAAGKDERERARARTLAEHSVSKLALAPGTWRSTHAAARAWLARQKL